MPAWIAITLAAAFLQNVRSALQKYLKSRMGTTGATFVRFGFGAPLAIAFVAVLRYAFGHPLPVPDLAFFGWTVLGGSAQIAAQALLVHLFSFRNFAVGTAYSRTEPAQAALFGLIFLDETVTAATIAAIAIAIFGVMLISVARTAFSWRALVTSLGSRTALIGIGSGTLFGISSVAYRGASLALGPSLPAPDFVMQAAFTLAVVIVLQSLAMLVWMAWRDPGELERIGLAWRPSLMVGLVGATASLLWFMAMTLVQAAYVKALGQVEMIFTIASTVLFFRESVTRTEIAGCLLIVLGVVGLVMALAG